MDIKTKIMKKIILFLFLMVFGNTLARSQKKCYVTKITIFNVFSHRNNIIELDSSFTQSYQFTYQNDTIRECLVRKYNKYSLTSKTEQKIIFYHQNNSLLALSQKDTILFLQYDTNKRLTYLKRNSSYSDLKACEFQYQKDTIFVNTFGGKKSVFLLQKNEIQGMTYFKNEKDKIKRFFVAMKIDNFINPYFQQNELLASLNFFHFEENFINKSNILEVYSVHDYYDNDYRTTNHLYEYEYNTENYPNSVLEYSEKYAKRKVFFQYNCK